MKQKYKKGDTITVKRSGSREIITGKIKETFKDYFWGHYLALVDTDKGERLITTETDEIIPSTPITKLIH
jgi:hypothetical protein